MRVLERLTSPDPLIAVELRPPRADLERADSIETWMGMASAVRRLAAQDTMIGLTDNAVGTAEEENLRHLMTAVEGDVAPDRLCPFLTTKHSLEYCLWYADRAVRSGYSALTVLGGDAAVGPPRCVPHAADLRRKIRERHPTLALGGWANPARDAARQVGYLLDPGFGAEFYLTQVVSHHDLDPVRRFWEAAQARAVPWPGVFGVFYYRSANPKTLDTLRSFLPVPVEGLTREFADGATPEQVCARSIRALADAGAKAVYVSNLPVGRAESTLARILNS